MQQATEIQKKNYFFLAISGWVEVEQDKITIEKQLLPTNIKEFSQSIQFVRLTKLFDTCHV